MTKSEIVAEFDKRLGEIHNRYERSVEAAEDLRCKELAELSNWFGSVYDGVLDLEDEDEDEEEPCPF